MEANGGFDVLNRHSLLYLCRPQTPNSRVHTVARSGGGVLEITTGNELRRKLQHNAFEHLLPTFPVAFLSLPDMFGLIAVGIGCRRRTLKLYERPLM